MIIYQLTHGGAWGWILAHRLTDGAGKEAILIAGNEHPTHFGASPAVELARQSGIFTRVLVSACRTCKNAETIEEIETSINEYYNNFFHDNNINLHLAEAIYTTCDLSHTFGAYLTMNNIHYYYVEMAENSLRLRCRVMREKRTDPTCNTVPHKIWWKWGHIDCSPDNLELSKLITPILYPNSKNPFPKNRLVLRYDSIKSIECIPSEYIIFLEKLFRMPNIVMHENKSILYCSSISPVRNAFIASQLVKDYISDLESAYVLSIQISIDLLVEPDSTPIIKQHPSTEIKDFDIYFPDAVKIPRIIDMCWFNRFNKDHNIGFQKMISLGSMSFEKAVGDYHSIKIGRNDIAYSLHVLLRCYAILNVLKNVCLKDNYKILIYAEHQYRATSNLIVIFAKLLFNIDCDLTNKVNFNDDNISAVIIAQPLSECSSKVFASIKKGLKKQVYFFPNADTSRTPDDIHKLGLADYYIRKRVIKKLEEGSLLPSHDEIFNVLAYDSSVRNKISAYTNERHMKYCKCTMTLSTPSESALKAWRQKEYNLWLERRILKLEERVSVLEATQDTENAVS